MRVNTAVKRLAYSIARDLRRVSMEARGPQQWLVLTPLAASVPAG